MSRDDLVALVREEMVKDRNLREVAVDVALVEYGGLRAGPVDPPGILPELPESDAQSTIQVLNLTVSTGLEQPPLIGDYRHLFLDDEHRPEVIAVLDTYQRSLEQLSARIAARNENIEQPYRTFGPVLLDVSVSVST
ncbi:hypothetical protein [Streptomyces sp. NPDC048590]|uniref:hypothetical protein n=1 Tax=Streptomyces sp. NPDC048590 TaxID=3365574 RepID=UPI003712AB9F